MAHKYESGTDVVIVHEGIELKRFTLYEDWAHTDARKYCNKIDRDPAFLKSELERIAKKEENKCQKKK
ncbi:MAG: hypothetical protein E3J23_08455 [Candidatus Stahlbacteria bacterium]|nr:MAG: hypothetical protein E3J23_08455 [Candidatus Stahlbacteria bacterium]